MEKLLPLIAIMDIIINIVLEKQILVIDMEEESETKRSVVLRLTIAISLSQI